VCTFARRWFNLIQLTNAGFAVSEIQVDESQLVNIADAGISIKELLYSGQVALENVRHAKRNMGRTRDPRTWMQGKIVYVWNNRVLKEAGVKAPWICNSSSTGEHRWVEEHASATSHVPVLPVADTGGCA